MGWQARDRVGYQGLGRGSHDHIFNLELRSNPGLQRLKRESEHCNEPMANAVS